MERKPVKIVTIGGGSSYTAELVEGFIKRFDTLPIREFWFVDVEAGKEKNEIVGGMAQRMFEAAGKPTTVHLTTNGREALKDADFVTTQFRVGQLDARINDERIPLKYGMQGQETNGAGGIFKAFRTIPVMLALVEDMKELCPNAWLINFTNPAGMVTEAVAKHGGWERIIGLCNVPIGQKKEASRRLGIPEEDLTFRFGGINHFHWHRVWDKTGKERTMELIDLLYAPDGEHTSEVANIKNIPFLYEQIKDLKMLPCGYHRFYYLEEHMLENQLKDYDVNNTRAEQVKKVEAELFELYKDPNLDHKPEQLSQRGGAYYSDAACEIINSIYNDSGTVMEVSIQNKGSLQDVDYDSAIEVSAYVGANGATPIAFGKLPTAQRGRLQLMKAMEEVTIEAAITGDYGKALQAFDLNPLIKSGKTMQKMLDEMLEVNKSYLPQFFKD